MKLRSAAGTMLVGLMMAACTTSATTTVAESAATSVPVEATSAASPTAVPERVPTATQIPVDPGPAPASKGCDVGLSLEPTAETENVLDESSDSFEFGSADSRYDSESWVITNPADPDGLRFQVWRFDTEFAEDQVFDGQVDGFEYLHYADEDRANFNGISGRLVDDPTAVVLVFTLNGSTQDTFDFFTSIGQVLDGASSVGDMSVIRSGSPKDVLETVELVETLHWRDSNTRIRALHVCGPAIQQGDFSLADALTISSPFNANQTYVSGEESVTPITIGDAEGFLLDIDEGSNDDYLVGVVGNAQRAIVFTIADSGADLELGLAIVARLHLEPT